MSYDIDNIVNICELAIKNCMTPAVYSALRRINKRLERIYGERYKLVLSGGSVFGIYFDESEVDVFKTHDFDVKFVDEDDNITMGTEHYREIIEMIDEIMTEMEQYLETKGTIVETTLNTMATSMTEENKEGYVFDIYAVPYSSSRYTPPEEKGFQKMWTLPLPKGVVEHEFNFTDTSFVSNIHFNYAVNITDKEGNVLYNKIHNGILIDLAPYTTLSGYDDHIGDASIDDLTEDDIRNSSRLALKNIKVRTANASYFKNRITSNSENPTIIGNVKKEGTLYYISLGYLIWDTIRMINFSITNPRSKKLMRYLKKYHYMLRSLSNLDYYANCKEHTFKDFNESCSE